MRKRRTRKPATPRLLDNVRRPPPKAPTRFTYQPNPIPFGSKKKGSNRSIFIWINTYNRPKDLYKLLNDITRSKKKHSLKILIVDDASDENYDNVLDKFSGKLNIEYHSMSVNHGKKNYWKLCTYAMGEIRKNLNFDYYIKLDDDGRLVDNFFDRCINVWESIYDTKKICLNFRLDSREGKKVWTGVLPQKKYFGNISVYKSQWVDMDFFAPIQFFSALNFYIAKPAPQRWRNPYISSGVGRDISTRLVARGLNLYLTTQTLVVHDEHNSMMNPGERNRHPLVTKPFTDPQYGVK